MHYQNGQQHNVHQRLSNIFNLRKVDLKSSLHLIILTGLMTLLKLIKTVIMRKNSVLPLTLVKDKSLMILEWRYSTMLGRVIILVCSHTDRQVVERATQLLVTEEILALFQ